MRVPIPPHPRRRLGQNFLHDENVLRKIIQFCEPTPNDTFVEIGAGTGALTALLAPRIARLVAVEIDKSLLPYLQQVPAIEILQTDIRDVDLCSIQNRKKVRVIGNLPYYISTTILTSLIAQKKCIEDMILMFQEEVARRITSPPSHPDYGMLSVLAQYFCLIEKGFRVSRNCFTPKPDVESRVLRFRFRENSKLDYAPFADFLVKAFSQRRKKLRNNLLRSMSVTQERLNSVFTKLGIPETARAENLSPEQFEQLILEFQF